MKRTLIPQTLDSSSSAAPAPWLPAVLASAIVVFSLAGSAVAQVRGAVETKPAASQPVTPSAAAPGPLEQALVRKPNAEVSDSAHATPARLVQVEIQAKFYELNLSDFEAFDFSPYGAKVPTPENSGAVGADNPPQLLRAGTFEVQTATRALEKVPSLKFLVAPSATLFSGEATKMVVGQEVSYPMKSDEFGNPTEGLVTTRFIGEELQVTATAEAVGHTISLNVRPITTKFEGFVEYGGPSISPAAGSTLPPPSGFFQPVFSVREFTTKVEIGDGATLVMSGLAPEQARKLNDKTSVPGDIPLIGRLFQAKGRQAAAEARVLLVFITAKIVEPEQAVRKPTAAGATP
jgi:Flp pilus assembly secretin CpaC